MSSRRPGRPRRHGWKLVEEAGQSMRRIVDSVKRVADIMVEIAGASREQRDGIEQVRETIREMGTKQQTVRLVEQSSAAAETRCAHAASVAK